MHIRNPRYREEIARIFEQAAFVAQTIGVRLTGCGPGWCESELDLDDRHGQQDGLVHAGVQATMADHTCGAAAGTLIGPGERLVSVEFKLQLLRAARGERLRCRARVLRPGRKLTAVEADIHVIGDGGEQLTGKMTATMAILPAEGGADQP